MTSISSSPSGTKKTKQQSPEENDPLFDNFQARMSKAFADATDGQPLFTVDTNGLYEAYLSEFPAKVRQHYRCHACRRFIETYGGLVTIDEHGNVASPIWASGMNPAFVRLNKMVTRAPIVGVFLTSDKKWGVAKSKSGWTHLAIKPPTRYVFSHLLVTPHQAAAEKAENHRLLREAIATYSRVTIETAVTILKSAALYRSEKVLDPAIFLRGVIHNATLDISKARKAALLWRAVATAPTGFCHPKSSMIGTLLDDIQLGVPFAEVERRFREKMDPGHYQRPTAPPKTGNIVQAEKIIEKLEAEGALRRRLAHMGDVQLCWMPREGKPVNTSGVFGHLKKPSPRAVQINTPPITMTWTKFSQSVLPYAENITFTPDGPDNYVALVTAAVKSAPPILQWDNAEDRNPVSWYVYRNGSTPTAFGLRPFTDSKIIGVTLKPSMWKGSFAHQGRGVIFLIEGACDKNSHTAGAALFPEILKSDFHSIRATIEAHSRGARLQPAGLNKQPVAGVLLNESVAWKAVFSVTTNGQIQKYRLDRWD